MGRKGYGRSHGLSHQGLVNRHSDSYIHRNDDSEHTNNIIRRVKCGYCEKWMSEIEYDEHIVECTEKSIKKYL